MAASSVRRGAVNKQYENLFASYESPVKIAGFLDLYHTTIPLFALDLADYAKAAHAHLQYVLGLACQDPESVCAPIERAMAEGKIPGSDPMDFFTHLVVRYREFLIVTFKRTSRIEDTGAIRGTSQALLIFDLLLIVLLIQARINPALTASASYDTDYDAVTRNHIAIHGSAYPIASYTQSQVYKSWTVMSSRFLGVDLERDSVDLMRFRMALLRRTADIVYTIETDPEEGSEYRRMLDMASTKSTGYVFAAKRKRQCTPRFTVEIMAVYVQTEVLIHIYYEHILELTATPQVKASFAATLMHEVVAYHHRASDAGERRNEDEDEGEEEEDGAMFTAWTQAVRHHLSVVESEASKDYTAVERLVEDIREHSVPAGYRTRFRFDNYLMAVHELDQVEGALYSNEKRAFMRSYRHRSMAFYCDGTRKFADDHMIKPLADLHMIQQFLLNNAIELLFIGEILFADYELDLVLLRTPETVSSEKRGYFNVNNITAMNMQEDTLFEPHRLDVWQLPITMRNIPGKPEESMPAVIKLARQFYVYYDTTLYLVEDAYEAFCLWMLIIIHKCCSHYVRRGRGKTFDLSFLKFYVLERLNEVPEEALTARARSVLAEQLGDPSVSAVQDSYIKATDAQAKMVDALFKDMDEEEE